MVVALSYRSCGKCRKQVHRQLTVVAHPDRLLLSVHIYIVAAADCAEDPATEPAVMSSEENREGSITLVAGLALVVVKPERAVLVVRLLAIQAKQSEHA